MKNYLVVFMTCLSFVLFGGTPVATIGYSPTTPLVGQVVTFSINGTCSTASILPGDDSPPTSFDSNGTAIHTYTVPGNYTLGLFCDDTFDVSGTIVVNAATPAPSLIPTLGQWGLIILGIVILGIGLVSMKQKKAVLSTIKK